MKITDPHVIEDGERNLIQAVQEDLDLDAVRQILKDRMGVSSLSSKGGQIVVHNNKIAFRLDFDINLSGSLLFDRQGNYIDESIDGEPGHSLREIKIAPEVLGDDDITIDPLALADEIPLVETGLGETGLYETDLEDEISIDLPEYDLEDDPEDAIELTDPEDLDSIELETDDRLSDEPAITGESNGFDIQDLEEEDLENQDIDDQDLDDEILLQEEMLDDDINDILKESREFWEQKKDS
ncbi:MAG: hypothetical protein KKC20_12645 [Proteobacteria bacterium]|nr:hypothetical protein [Pseudomonadota bacterium]